MKMGKKPEAFVMVFTDGGPDHYISFLNVMISWLAYFISGGCDSLVVGRTVPTQSWTNLAERLMSVLDFTLSNCALSRDLMGDEFEKDMKKCNSMTSIRKLANKLDSTASAANSSHGFIDVGITAITSDAVDASAIASAIVDDVVGFGDDIDVDVFAQVITSVAPIPACHIPQDESCTAPDFDMSQDVKENMMVEDACEEEDFAIDDGYEEDDNHPLPPPDIDIDAPLVSTVFVIFAVFVVVFQR